MKKLLLTGASGLIGSHFIKKLAGTCEVHAISRSPQPPEAGVTWHLMDLRRELDCSQLPESIDTVVYLAQSEDFRDFPAKAQDVFRVNTEQMLAFLDYAQRAGAQRFIYASSGGVYGTGSDGFSEDFAIPASGNLGFYLSTKLCAEILAENYRPYMHIISLRFFFVYGAGQKRSMLVPRLVDNVRNGVAIKLQGADGIMINPTHVSDAVMALQAALSLEGFHKINVAGPEVLTLKGIAKIIGDRLGVAPVFEHDMQVTPANLIGDIENMKKHLNTPSRHFAAGLDDIL
ncbi:NAD(P)-dependent oxidoreductase [Herbaspirillum sp. WKF16]|uniref:NAD-dependent epimerase/dehydratase family protein n=1 Tax=Herbaspirillum sp. WKF16 TaxID=3028312 RepID=UPI0023AA0ABA|nr:NAD(P)-dependent oxidoreductase [Herbaspirillum sp. WKF16]WDZ96601.1 NAD(P)-dependent oxidoreductase [Herbaspirillum sp. WKF16]